jgi:glutamate/tyrosine decarboxylase-like PLP-dependent enzyme
LHPSLDQINEFEQLSRQLEPDATTRNHLFDLSSSYINQFLDSLPDTKTYIKAKWPRLESLLIENEGKSFESLLDIYKNEVNHAGINSASGGHLGYIPGGGLWICCIADMIAAATNKNSSVFFSGQGAVVMENQLIDWLCKVVGYPDNAHGYLSSGGSMANLSAITVARDVHQIDSGIIARSVIYTTDQVHHCIDKAIHINGLDESIQRIIPVNDQLQMDVNALDKSITDDLGKGLNPFLVIATAGTTNSGCIDPLNEIADICNKNKIWFHVDAAYGGFFMLLEEMKDKFRGIERSDSLVLDPHKGLFLPFGTGVLLVRNGKQLIKSHSYHASYLMDEAASEEISPSACSPELTRHFRGLRMWLAMHWHGLDVFKACLREKIQLCLYFQDKIQRLGFETRNTPELSVSVFRYPSPNSGDFNRELVETLHEDGRVFFSGTTIQGEFWIRCAVFNFRTHLREIDLGIAMIKECLQKIIK